MAEIMLKKKQRKKLNNKNNNDQKKIRIEKYGFILSKELDARKVYQIAGDITINIDQLLNRESLSQNASWNEFIQVKEVKRYNQSQFIDVFMDTDVHIRSNITIPIEFLKRSQQQDLLRIAHVMEEYQRILNEKIKEEAKLDLSQESSKIINLKGPFTFLDCDEDHGWSFLKSVQKAEIVLNEIKEETKSSQNHCSYILFKGNKYDQSISMIGHSMFLLKDFFCLNDEQINRISYAKPSLYYLKYQHQNMEYLFNRINSQVRLLKQNKSETNPFRSGLKFLRSETIDVQSIDNFSVNVQLNHYLYVLSNYKNQIDDVLWVGKFEPIGDQSASQVLKGMRNLKKYLSSEEQNSNANPFFNSQIYSDIIYEASSEIFRDRFYPIVENNLYHSILETL